MMETRIVYLALTLGVFATLLATSSHLHWALIAFAWAGWGMLAAATLLKWTGNSEG